MKKAPAANPQIHEVPIKDIQVVENVRTKIKDSHLRELMDSIKQHGLESPIKVGKTKTEKYVLIFGQRRMEACKKLGWNTIQAQIVDEPAIEDLLLRNVTENIQRKDNTPIEVGRICHILKKRHGMSASEIASRLSIPKTNVERAMSLYLDIPTELREHIGHMESSGGAKNGKIPATVAGRIMRMKNFFNMTDNQTTKMLQLARTEELNTGNIEVISSLLSDGASPERAMKEKDNFQVYRIDLIANREEVETKALAARLSPLDYLRSIVYGGAGKIVQPTFIKEAKKLKA